jgi:hypothetical protein
MWSSGSYVLVASVCTPKVCTGGCSEVCVTIPFVGKQCTTVCVPEVCVPEVCTPDCTADYGFGCDIGSTEAPDCKKGRIDDVEVNFICLMSHCAIFLHCQYSDSEIPRIDLNPVSNILERGHESSGSEQLL